jgi:hypothetical protein
VGLASGLKTHTLEPYREDGLDIAVQLVSMASMHLTHLATLMVLEGLPRNFLFLQAVLEQGETRLSGYWVFLGATFPEDWQPPVWRDVLLAQLQAPVPANHHERFLAYVLQAAHARRSSYPPPPAAYGEHP